MLSIDLLQKSISSCRGEAFALEFIGQIKVFIRKRFALLEFMQEVYWCQLKPWRLEVAATKTKSACAD